MYNDEPCLSAVNSSYVTGIDDCTVKTVTLSLSLPYIAYLKLVLSSIDESKKSLGAAHTSSEAVSQSVP